VGVGITAPAYVGAAGRPPGSERLPETAGGGCRVRGIPLLVWSSLLDGGLQLGARGDLDALAGGDLDLCTRLRVAAGASRGGDLLERDPAGIETLLPLATASETVEKRESRTPDTADWLCPVALAMLATSSVLVMDLSAMGIVLRKRRGCRLVHCSDRTA
jgi:hypothetical protein